MRSVLDRAAQVDPLGSSRKSLPHHWPPGELLSSDIQSVPVASRLASAGTGRVDVPSLCVWCFSCITLLNFIPEILFCFVLLFLGTFFLLSFLELVGICLWSLARARRVFFFKTANPSDTDQQTNSLGACRLEKLRNILW